MDLLKRSGKVRFPKDECAKIMVHTIVEFLVKNPQLYVVRICDVDTETLNAFKKYLLEYTKKDNQSQKSEQIANTTVKNNSGTEFQWFWQENDGNFLPFDAGKFNRKVTTQIQI